MARNTHNWLLASAAALLGANLLLSTVGFAQSGDLLLACQRFEEAKLADDLPRALELGRIALQLAEATPGRDEVALVDLLRSLAEVQAKAGDSAAARLGYERVLAIQQSELGAAHPDLVPTLQALAELRTRDADYTQAEALLQRILDIERAAYGERHENVLASLARLREVYRAAERGDDAARIEALIDRLSITERGAPLTRAARKTERRYRQEGGSATVQVFYGTNRARTGESKPALFYGKGRGELEYGYVDVSIPESHQEGELETQSRWSLYSLVSNQAELKQRYVLLQDVTALSRGTFVSSLRQQIKSQRLKDAFIFVHGFNTSFEDAARRTAQLAYDLDFDGTPMMYSWPSQASTTAYTVDEAVVGISGRRLAQFLQVVISESGAERVHLIAHSMGNRTLIEALQTYLANRPAGERKQVFGQVVFTAPDVDRDYFLETIDSLRDSAARITLYASDNDLALKTSQKFHGAPRAGLAGAHIITLRGMDTIDMSEVQSDMLGHNYYAADAGAIYDLFRLLWRGEPPQQRCGMTDRSRSQSQVWLFNVKVCAGQDLLHAGVLLKRFGERARARVRARLLVLTDPTEKQEWTRILTRLDGLLIAGKQ